MTAQAAPRPFSIIDREFFTQIESEVEGRFSIDPQAASTFFETGPEWKFSNGALVHDVFQNPTAIFGGLERGNFADAFCYCGIPPHRYDNDGEVTEMPTNQIFVGFSIVENQELVFFDWEFRDVDPWNSGFPDGWASDFGEQLWPLTGDNH